MRVASAHMQVRGQQERALIGRGAQLWRAGRMLGTLSARDAGRLRAAQGKLGWAGAPWN